MADSVRIGMLFDLTLLTTTLVLSDTATSSILLSLSEMLEDQTNASVPAAAGSWTSLLSLEHSAFEARTSLGHRYASGKLAHCRRQPELESECNVETA